MIRGDFMELNTNLIPSLGCYGAWFVIGEFYV